MLDTHGIIYVLRLITGASQVDAASALPYYIDGPFYRSVMSLSNLHSAVERAFCVSGDTAMNKTCLYCGGEFWVSRARKPERRRYCSMACRKADRPRLFWENVDKSGECWVWTAGKRGDYGYLSIDGIRMGAHRMAYILAKGPIPRGMEICHKCDNPPCVRPDHLFLGTTQDNVADMVKKGRITHGESHHNAVLSASLVIDIRQKHHSGVAQRALAREYGISRGAIRHIVKNLTWKHVDS